LIKLDLNGIGLGLGAMVFLGGIHFDERLNASQSSINRCSSATALLTKMNVLMSSVIVIVNNEP